jgi:hypothetical protein
MSMLAGRPGRPYVAPMTDTAEPAATPADPAPAAPAKKPTQVPLPKEIGGTGGPEPTRYGDWEHKGRCTDF